MAHESLRAEAVNSEALTAACAEHVDGFHTACRSRVSKLTDQVAEALRTEAAELTERWKAQVRSHAPRLTEDREPADPQPETAEAQTIVHAMADAVAGTA